MATIVVVDDEHTILEVVVNILTMEGYTVLAARDGLEARGVLGGTLPDLVVTDMMMPGLDGFGLVRWMRSQPTLANVPALVVSAVAPPLFDGLEPVTFIAKPFELAALLDAVTRSLGKTSS
jgi:CheY-like chemotaxis protein